MGGCKHNMASSQESWSDHQQAAQPGHQAALGDTSHAWKHKAGHKAGHKKWRSGMCSCRMCHRKKERAAVKAAVLFAIIASPFAFRTVQSVLGNLVRVAESSGVPTVAGLLLHALVFYIATRATMKL